MPLSPSMVGSLGDADLAAEVGDGQAFGQVAVGVLQQAGHFDGNPSLAHGSLPVRVYRGTSISGGPVSGGSPGGRRSSTRGCRAFSETQQSRISPSRTRPAEP